MSKLKPFNDCLTVMGIATDIPAEEVRNLLGPALKNLSYNNFLNSPSICGCCGTRRISDQWKRATSYPTMVTIMSFSGSEFPTVLNEEGLSTRNQLVIPDKNGDNIVILWPIQEKGEKK